jgi:hypothetical protein
MGARAGEWHLLARKDSGSSTGSHGEGCAHTLLRIGSITLPSSMDLRQYLEQMQARTRRPPLVTPTPLLLHSKAFHANMHCFIAATPLLCPRWITRLLCSSDAGTAHCWHCRDRSPATAYYLVL